MFNKKLDNRVNMIIRRIFTPVGLILYPRLSLIKGFDLLHTYDSLFFLPLDPSFSIFQVFFLLSHFTPLLSYSVPLDTSDKTYRPLHLFFQECKRHYFRILPVPPPYHLVSRSVVVHDPRVSHVS